MNDFADSAAHCIGRFAALQAMHNSRSPFPIWLAEGRGIAFHLIDLEAWQHLQTSVDGYFFVNLTDFYQQQGIQLVHLWEDVWRARRALAEARIAVMLGRFVRYHARQTSVQAINNPALKDFLRLHHMQAAIGGRYRYGLFEGGALLAAASFSGGCPVHRGGRVYRSYELLRFATRAGCTAAGGLGKLLAHFIRHKSPDDIMTYVDCDWGTGRGLRQLGFECIGRRPPQQFWIDAHCERRYASASAPPPRSPLCCNSGSYKFLKALV